jgi:hypothetical protein
MPFPDTITAQGNPNGPTPGPWVAPNGFLYALTFGVGVGITLSMMKSVDGGVTWALMNDAGSPADNGLGVTSGVLVGSKLWTSNWSLAVGGTAIQVTAFDTATDTWGAATVTANLTADGNQAAIFYRASDKNLIIARMVTSLNVGGKKRTGYFTFDTIGLTSSAWVAMGETGASAFNWECIGIIAGAGECDFFMWATTAGASQLWRQPLSDLGVLGAAVMIATNANITIYPQVYSDGTTAVLNYAVGLTASVYTAPVSTWAFGAPQLLTVAPAELSINSVGIVRLSGSGTIAFVLTGAGNILTAQDAGIGFGPLATVGADPGPFNLAVNLFANTLGPMQWGIVFWGAPTTYFWQAAAAPLVPVSTGTANPPQIRIVPFPGAPDPCCYCPPLVTCMKCDPGGKMLVTAKGQMVQG